MAVLTGRAAAAVICSLAGSWKFILLMYSMAASTLWLFVCFRARTTISCTNAHIYVLIYCYWESIEYVCTHYLAFKCKIFQNLHKTCRAANRDNHKLPKISCATMFYYFMALWKTCQWLVNGILWCDMCALCTLHSWRLTQASDSLQYTAVLDSCPLIYSIYS